MAGTCARDRHALQQLALIVHVKHSDLTCVQFIIARRLVGTMFAYQYQLQHRNVLGKEMFDLTTHSTHFISGYMATDIIW